MAIAMRLVLVQLGLQHGKDTFDTAHLIDFLRFELHAEILLQSKDQIKVLDGIPALNILRRSLSRDLAGGKLENVGSNDANALEYWRGHSDRSPFMMCSLTHSGQGSEFAFRSRLQSVPLSLCSIEAKP